VDHSTDGLLEKGVEERPSATVAERWCCYLKHLTETQLSEAVGTTVSATNLLGQDCMTSGTRALQYSSWQASIQNTSRSFTATRA
jgi:hypothetical protein